MQPDVRCCYLIYQVGTAADLVTNSKAGKHCWETPYLLHTFKSTAVLAQPWQKSQAERHDHSFPRGKVQWCDSMKDRGLVRHAAKYITMGSSFLLTCLLTLIAGLVLLSPGTSHCTLCTLGSGWATYSLFLWVVSNMFLYILFLIKEVSLSCDILPALAHMSNSSWS